MENNKDWDNFLEILEFYKQQNQPLDQDNLVALLRETQELLGAVTKEAREQILEVLMIKPAILTVILKRYPSLKAEAYEKKITVCTGSCCMAKNAGLILKTLEEEFQIKKGEVTKNNKYKLETRCCLKNCKSAPNIMIDQNVYGNITVNSVKDISNL